MSDAEMLDAELDKLMEAYNRIKDYCKRNDKHLYEQWKAGGFIIDDNVASMYPDVQQVVDQLAGDVEEENEADYESTPIVYTPPVVMDEHLNIYPDYGH